MTIAWKATSLMMPWMRFMEKAYPSRRIVGRRTVKVHASKNRKAVTRQQPIFEPKKKKKCVCQLPQDALSAKSPNLNVAENYFSEMMTKLTIGWISEGWPKNWQELQDRIEDIIANIPKSWYRKAFNSLPARWGKCVKSFGAMTDFYCPKYSWLQ